MTRRPKKAVAADAVEGGPTPTATIARETYKTHHITAKLMITWQGLRYGKHSKEP
jgi:hypothetical protein